MKKRILAALIVGLSVVMCACSSNSGAGQQKEKETEQQEDDEKETEKAEEESEEETESDNEIVTVTLSMDNINDYIDFEQIGDSSYIITSKQYENGLAYLRWTEPVIMKVAYYFYDSEYRIDTYSLFGTIGSEAKPMIVEAQGTVEFVKDANTYLKEDNTRVVEYRADGEQQSEEENNGRSKYFNEYPY